MMDKIQLTKNNLWHYTDLEGLMGILETQCLWATDYRHLNDCSELNHARGILRTELFQRVVLFVREQYGKSKVAREYIDKNGGIDKIAAKDTKDTVDMLRETLLEGKPLSTVPCILSFCLCGINDSNIQENGLLSQWRGYGPDGGYAIIFNLTGMIECFKKECESFRYAISDFGDVCYDCYTLNIQDDLFGHLDEIIMFAYKFYYSRVNQNDAPQVTEKTVSALAHCLTRFKHRGFEEEKEYRFFVFAYDDENVLKESRLLLNENKLFKKIYNRGRKGTAVSYVGLFEKTPRLPIERIIVGPHKDKEKRKASLEVYLKSKGLHDVKVSYSDIPYIGAHI